MLNRFLPACLLGVCAVSFAPSIAADTQDSAAAPTTYSAEAADTPRFDIWEFRIDSGALVEGGRIEQQFIERAVYPPLGPGRTIDDVEAARRDVEKVFRDAGFGTVLVDIPEQDVVGGVVLLSVVEGKVARLEIAGSRYFSLGRIKRQVPSLATGNVPYLPQVQKELQRANQASPDRTITPVLRPGRNPGTLDVELKVKDELPLHARVELNDRFSQNTSRLRLNAEVRYGNLWQREHAISAAYQVSPENRDNVEVFSSTYSFRLPDSDKVVTLYGVKTTSDVAAIGTLGVVGDGIIGGARLTMPLPARGRWYHTLTLGGDYKDFGESIDLIGADTLNTPISYHVWNALYSGVLLGEHGETNMSVGVTAAPRGLGNKTQEFQDKRFRARPNFVYLNAGLSHLRELPHGAELKLELEGQVTDAPLISNEQFGVGGVQSLRGYLESQQFYDDGLRASIELRSPDFGRQVWEGLTSARVHGFVEGASGRILDALPGQPATATLWSAGLGFRLAALDDFAADLDWAVPLTSSNQIDAGESRVHFRVEYGF